MSESEEEPEKWTLEQKRKKFEMTGKEKLPVKKVLDSQNSDDLNKLPVEEDDDIMLPVEGKSSEEDEESEENFKSDEESDHVEDDADYDDCFEFVADKGQFTPEEIRSENNNADFQDEQNVIKGHSSLPDGLSTETVGQNFDPKGQPSFFSNVLQATLYQNVSSKCTIPSDVHQQTVYQNAVDTCKTATSSDELQYTFYQNVSCAEDTSSFIVPQDDIDQSGKIPNSNSSNKADRDSPEQISSLQVNQSSSDQEELSCGNTESTPPPIPPRLPKNPTKLNVPPTLAEKPIMRNPTPSVTSIPTSGHIPKKEDQQNVVYPNSVNVSSDFVDPVSRGSKEEESVRDFIPNKEDVIKDEGGDAYAMPSIKNPQQQSIYNVPYGGHYDYGVGQPGSFVYNNPYQEQSIPGQEDMSLTGDRPIRYPTHGEREPSHQYLRDPMGPFQRMPHDNMHEVPTEASLHGGNFPYGQPWPYPPYGQYPHPEYMQNPEAYMWYYMTMCSMQPPHDLRQQQPNSKMHQAGMPQDEARKTQQQEQQQPTMGNPSNKPQETLPRHQQPTMGNPSNKPQETSPGHQQPTMGNPSNKPQETSPGHQHMSKRQPDLPQQKKKGGGKGGKSKPKKPQEEEVFVCIDNLEPSITRGILSNFLENNSLDCDDVTVDESGIIFCNENTVAVIPITYTGCKEDIDKDSVLKAINRAKKRPSSMKDMNICDVERSKHIIVSCEYDLPEKEVVKSHFEAVGGQVAKISDEDGCYLIKFKCDTTVSKVCGDASSYKIKGKVLFITPLYVTGNYGKIFDETKHKVKLPEPLAIKDMDEYLHDFVIKSQSIVEKVNSKLQPNHAEVKVTNKLQIECLLDQKTPNVRHIIKSWEKNVKQIWDDFVDENLQVMELQISDDVWTPIASVFEPIIGMCNTSQIQIQKLHDDFKLVFAGERAIVEEMHHKFDKENQRIDAEIKRKNSIQTEKKTFVGACISLLKRLGTFAQLDNIAEDFECSGDVEKGEIVFTGTPEDINKARLAIAEALNNFEKWTFVEEDLSSTCLKLLKSETVKEMLKSEFGDKGLTVEFEVIDDKFKIHASTSEQKPTVDTIMKSFIKESTITLDSTSKNVLETTSWKQELADIQESHYEKVLITPSKDSKIVVTTTVDLQESVYDRINRFIADHSIYSENINIKEAGKVEFLTRHCTDELKYIQQNLSGDFVELDLNLKNKKLEIIGTKDGIRKARREMEDKLDQITYKKHTETKPGIEKIIKPDSDSLPQIEEETKTLILFSDPEQHGKKVKSTSPVLSVIPQSPVSYVRELVPSMQRKQENTDHGSLRKTTALVKGPYRCSNGILINLVKGELAKQKGDVIVCSTSADLNLQSGAAGKNLVKVGGDELMREIQQKYPHPVDIGDVAVISGYNLPCQEVYLGCLPAWNSEKGKATKTVYLFMGKCLETADQSGHTSVVFSALGTGQLRYPKDKAAELMYQSVIDFDKAHPVTSIKKVQIVCFHADQDTCSVFENEERMRLNPGSVKRVSVKGPYQTKNKITISLVKAEIGKHKADVLVCAVTKNLDIKGSGASSKSLYDNGGESLQTECTTKYPKGLTGYGEIASIAGGNLKCKEVLLTSLPNEETKSQTVLCKFVSECLEYADKKGYNSIAFPAIGTGKINYDRASVAKHFYKEVKKFSENHSSTTVRDVHFVLYPRDVETIKVFEAEQTKQLSKRQSYNSGTNAYKSPTCQITVMVETSSISKKQVDAIVCCGRSNLDLRHGKAMQALLKEGGESLQDECHGKYPDGIQPKEVAVISGGNLKCKHVFLGTLPRYGSGHSEAEMILKEFALKCLTTASSMGLTSIAFPCLGSGFNGYPHDRSASLLYEAVVDFDSKSSSTSIKTIHFVSLADDTKSLVAFQNEEVSMNSSMAAIASATTIPKPSTFSSISSSIFTKTRIFFYGDKTPKPAEPSIQAILGKKQNEVVVGNTTLNVSGGNLIDQKVDAIVNSTNLDLDFSQGGVSGAIQKKCDTKLLEAERKSKVAEMQREKITSTSGCGISNIKYIIHIECQNTLSGWEDVIIKTLDKADKLQCTTIAFPVLGTGDGYTKFNEQNIGHTFLKAVSKYASKPNARITVVKIVAFQEGMVFPISKAIRDECANPTEQSILGKVSEMAETVGLKPRAGVGFSVPKTIDSVTVWIYSDDDLNIRKAQLEIETLVMSLYSSEMIDDSLIGVLRDSEVQKLQYIDQSYPVKLKIEIQQNRVIIDGPKKDVSDAKDEVQKVLRNISYERFQDEEAEHIATFVQWSVMVPENGTFKLEHYPKRINMQLENAYKNKDSPKIVTLHSSDGDLLVDLQTMKEYPDDDHTDTSDVIRKEKIDGAQMKLPEIWVQMGDKESVKVVPLLGTDAEYKQVAKKFTDSVLQGVYNTKHGNYPGNRRTPTPADHPIGQFNNLKIVKIERIQNPSLYQQYAAKKDSMEKSGHIPSGIQLERELWHGAPPNAIVSINYYGFNRSYCNQNTGTAAWYGNGVYFASDASYSARDWVSKKDSGGKKKMYLCKVLTGDTVQGSQGMRVLPEKQPGVIYNSAVDYPPSPMEYVIFNDTQAYPEYCIEFTI